MAEIKSTLELVMERTRNLSMSEEDKRKQAAREFNEAVNGLVLKYLDGQTDLDGFQAELSRLEGGPWARAGAAVEIAMRIDPLADNQLLLNVIKYGFGGDISGLEALLNHFRRAVKVGIEQAEERIRVDLLKRGISGSAVIPNLEADKDWTGRLARMVEAFREKLAWEITQLRHAIARME
jgi:hypothetical protein